MTRKHNAPRRANHHERASIAAGLVRAYRKAMKPFRLWVISMQERNADDHLYDLAASHELLFAVIEKAQKRRVEIEAKRMAVERGIA